MSTSNFIWPILVTALAIIVLSALGLTNYMSAAAAIPEGVEVGGWYQIWLGMAQQVVGITVCLGVVFAWWRGWWVWFYRLAVFAFAIGATWAAYRGFVAPGPSQVSLTVLAWPAWLVYLIWIIITRLGPGAESE